MISKTLFHPSLYILRRSLTLNFKLERKSIFWRGYFSMVDFSDREKISSPKIDINIRLTCEKLKCKGEPYRLSGVARLKI